MKDLHKYFGTPKGIEEYKFKLDLSVYLDSLNYRVRGIKQVSVPMHCVEIGIPLAPTDDKSCELFARQYFMSKEGRHYKSSRVLSSNWEHIRTSNDLKENEGKLHIKGTVEFYTGTGKK